MFLLIHCLILIYTFFDPSVVGSILFDSVILFFNTFNREHKDSQLSTQLVETYFLLFWLRCIKHVTLQSYILFTILYRLYLTYPKILKFRVCVISFLHNERCYAIFLIVKSAFSSIFLRGRTMFKLGMNMILY